MEWAYGITTVPTRAGDLFPRTLRSLARAGFDQPRIFADGCSTAELYEQFGLPVTSHWPNVRTAGNWILSLHELYLRQPRADRYAIFQDDFVTCLNLRKYLENSHYPTKAYWNLYTFPANQKLAPENKTYRGFYPSDQRGKGAVALVFDREAVCNLLAQRYLVDRFQNEKKGHQNIDGGIIDTLIKIGWKEYVHNPSLVQHTGIQSSMGNRVQPLAESFPGEDFDAMTLPINKPIDDDKVRVWEVELASLEKAMKEDQERLAQTHDTRAKLKLENHIRRYQKRITAHLRSANKRA